MYLSTSAPGAFIETLGSTLKFGTVVDETFSSYAITKVFLNEALRLVDLSGAHLVTLGLDERIATGDDFEMTQQWSSFFFRHPNKVDGIYYRARHDGNRWSVGLYDRAMKKIHKSKCQTESLAAVQRSLRREIILAYRLRLIM